MTYVLIFVVQMFGGSAPTASGTVEFNSMEACQAAASTIVGQVGRIKLPVLVCAPKGKKE